MVVKVAAKAVMIVVHAIQTLFPNGNIVPTEGELANGNVVPTEAVVADNIGNAVGTEGYVARPAGAEGEARTGRRRGRRGGRGRRNNGDRAPREGGDFTPREGGEQIHSGRC